MSSTEQSGGKLTVFEMAPLMNGWAAAIIFKCAIYGILRLPRNALKAQSNISRCSGLRPLQIVALLAATVGVAFTVTVFEMLEVQEPVAPIIV